MSLFRQHPVREEALSAYIDGALSEAERSRVEGHLQGCVRCRDAVEELRAVRGALEALSRERAPRSFALRRADVEAPRQAAPSSLVRASPLLGAVATIALLACFSLVGLDVARGPSGGGERAAGVPGALEAPQGADRSATSAPPGPSASEDAAGGAPEQPAATAPDNALSFGPAGSPEATQPAESAGLQRGKAPAPQPAAPEVSAAAEQRDDARSGLRAAEAATAAVAVVAGGAFVLARRRRRV